MGSLLQAALAQSPAVEFHTEQGGAGSNPGAALFLEVRSGDSPLLPLMEKARKIALPGFPIRWPVLASVQRDRSDILEAGALDHRLDDDARYVALLVELMAARGALVVDVLTLGEQLFRLLPLARHDFLARRGGDLAQRRRQPFAGVLAELLDRQADQEGPVIGLCREGRGRVEPRGLRGTGL